jgi:quercetin dioxygenase-like cupin family protein
MTLQYPLINLESTDATTLAGGFAVQTGIDRRHGAGTSACRYTLAPGSDTDVFALDADELILLATGELDGQLGGQTHRLRDGHCLFVPAGLARQYKNAGPHEAVFVSFIIDAPDIQGALCEPASPPPDGVKTIHLDGVTPERMAKADGWQITDFRLPFGSHNGVGSTLFRARFFPGAVHAKHRHDKCDEIYHIISGHGLAGAGTDRVEVRTGDFHYIPKGVEHWLHNLSETDPIEVIGTYIHAGSVADTGYVFMGNVTPDDIAARTA